MFDITVKRLKSLDKYQKSHATQSIAKAKLEQTITAIQTGFNPGNKICIGITHGKRQVTTFKVKTGGMAAFPARNTNKYIQNSQPSQGYIFRILQHFMTKFSAILLTLRCSFKLRRISIVLRR